MPRLTGLILAPLLTLLGIALLVGCIPISSPPTRVQGSDVADLVGSVDSSKPLRPGAITRSQVIAVLGAPSSESRPNRELTYQWTEDVGFYLLCSPRWPSEGPERYRTRHAVLTFDSDEVLRKYRIETVE